MDQNTPFRAVPREELEVGGSRVIKGANGDEVAFVQFDEDAEFIVKACNSRDQLVAALKRFTAYGKTFAYRESEGCPIDQAYEALAAAGEK